MARMYPEEYREDPDSPSEAERQLYNAFKRQLDDRYLVFHRCGWLSRDPKGRGARDGEVDFVIARADLGVLTIEVKGGGIGNDPKSGKWYKVDWRGRRGEDIDDPVRQILRSKMALLTKLKEMPGEARRWWQIGHALAFPDIEFTSDRADLAPDIVLDRSSAKRVDAWVEHALKFWSDKEKGRPPGRDGLELLVRLLGHSFEIAPVIGAQLRRSESELARLTVSQFRVLDGLRRFRRVLICGCAGSGKTMLAVEKARQLADQGFRVLLACYNRRLRDHVRGYFQGSRNVLVDNFHGLCHDWTAKAKIPVNWSDDRAFWRQELPGLFKTAIRKVKTRFDAIIVDEGQDFEPSWWPVMQSLLADRKKGVLYVFYDDNQNLFTGELKFPPVESQYDLTENCRNTRKIHDVVQRYYQADRQIRAEGPAGWKPEVSVYASEGQLLDQVERAIDRFVTKHSIPAHRIVILTSHGEKRSAVWRARRFGKYTLTQEAEPKPNEIRWSSVHGFKGLESPAVILAEVEPLSHTELDRLLYVGCSRAQLHLAVIVSELAAGEARLGERGQGARP